MSVKRSRGGPCVRKDDGNCMFACERSNGRHCEEQRDEAIQTAAAEKVWIASAYALWASADRSLRSQ